MLVRRLEILVDLGARVAACSVGRVLYRRGKLLVRQAPVGLSQYGSLGLLLKG